MVERNPNRPAADQMQAVIKQLLEKYPPHLHKQLTMDFLQVAVEASQAMMDAVIKGPDRCREKARRPAESTKPPAA